VTERLRRAGRAAVAAIALGALLAGAPYALARYTGSPVPRHMPGMAQARAFLASPLSDEAVIRLLADAVWFLWAIFAVSVIAEAAASARHRTAPRLPVISPVQALAAALVGAAFLASAPAPGTAHPAALRAMLAASAPPHLAPGPREQPAASLAQPAAQTEGRPSPAAGYEGGQRARTYQVYLVVAGDDLWDVAQRHLGDAERWTEIYALNKDRPQPDGEKLTNPSLILPGWLLLIPVPGQAPQQARGAPPASASAPATRPPARPSASPAASPAPRPSATGPSAAAPSRAPASPAPDHSTGTQAEPPPRGGARLPSGEIIGYTLVALTGGAAVAVARLCLRRARQPSPVPGTAPEYPPDGPALRAARHAYLTSDVPDEDQDLVPAEDFPAPRPAGYIPPRTGESAQSVSAAVRSGREVDLALAAAPGFGFTGPGGDAAVRAMAVTILAQRTRDQAQVILCGPAAVRLLAGSSDALPDGVPGLTAATAADALAALEAELTRRHRILQAAGTASISDYRAAHPDEDLPVITVIAASGPHAPRLAGILSIGRQLGITGILSGPWPDSATTQVAANGRVLAASGPARALEGARMLQLPVPAAIEMLEALAAAAGAPAPRAEPAQERPLSAPPPDQDPAPGTRLAELSVLGPFQLAAAGGLITRGMRRKAAELLAYLAVYPDGATTPVLLEALWPDTPPERSGPILHAATTNVRGLLRSATQTPESAFIVRVGDHLRIDARLTDCDLWAFRAALAAAASAASDQDRIAALEEATRLWRGDLADGMDAVWIEEHRETLRRDAADALARLAELHEQDDADKALAVLDRAITVDRYQEELYRRIMTVQAALGRTDAARRTYQLLESRLAELDAEPEERTARLLHQIMHRRAQRRPVVGSADQ
jgi:DNA-binding SARP family transcriptional activator